MSQLLEIKALIFSNLTIESKELHKAIFDVFDSINGDLDTMLYEPSGETEATIERLNQVLSSEAELAELAEIEKPELAEEAEDVTLTEAEESEEVINPLMKNSENEEDAPD